MQPPDRMDAIPCTMMEAHLQDVISDMLPYVNRYAHVHKNADGKLINTTCFEVNNHERYYLR